jgi:hypothetical protein
MSIWMTFIIALKALRRNAMPCDKGKAPSPH